MRRELREPYLTDPLLRELIPVRITPPPGTGHGPTAQWEAHQADECDADIIDLDLGYEAAS